MVSDEGWKQHWSIQIGLTAAEAKQLARAIRRGQNLVADKVKDLCEKAAK